MTKLVDESRRPRGRPPALGVGPFSIALGSLLALATVTPRRLGGGVKKPGRLPRAVQVRLEVNAMQTLERIEAQAKKIGRTGFSRSSMIRDAITAYAEPLVALLDREGRIDGPAHSRFVAQPDGDDIFGETTRIRLGPDLVEQLDRIEAYARGLGYRNVTRSSLIRDSVSAYLAGFREELMRNDAEQGRSHAGGAGIRR